MMSWFYPVDPPDKMHAAIERQRGENVQRHEVEPAPLPENDCPRPQRLVVVVGRVLLAAIVLYLAGASAVALYLGQLGWLDVGVSVILVALAVRVAERWGVIAPW